MCVCVHHHACVCVRVCVCSKSKSKSKKKVCSSLDDKIVIFLPFKSESSFPCWSGINTLGVLVE